MNTSSNQSLMNKGSERPIFRSDGWEHTGQLVFKKEEKKGGGSITHGHSQ